MTSPLVALDLLYEQVKKMERMIRNLTLENGRLRRELEEEKAMNQQHLLSGDFPRWPVTQ